jgi:hypothetical protein
MNRLIPAIAALGLLTVPATLQAVQPNILFILTDDLGPGDLGVLWQNGRSGDQKFATPHLDTFAAEGVRLTRHYCPAPVCAPSRASLLLGVHQGHANVRDNQFDKALEDNLTLGSVMKEAGYATATIGKWGLHGGSSAPAHPQHRGFDYFFGYLEHGDAHRHYPTETGMNLYDGFTDVGSQLDKCYSTDLWTARAKDWIADHHAAQPTQPFFLYLSYTAPHARLNVPTQAYPAGGGLSGGLQWNGIDTNPATPTINTATDPLFPALRSGPKAAPGATRQKQIPGSDNPDLPLNEPHWHTLQYTCEPATVRRRGKTVGCSVGQRLACIALVSAHPATLNNRKGDKVGERKMQLARKWNGVFV